MSQLKSVLFLGLGGAGQRHLRHLRTCLPEGKFSTYRSTRSTPLLNANFTVNQGGSVEDNYRLESHTTLNQALEKKPQLAVISTPSSLHYSTMLKAAQSGVGVFVEKPWSHELKGFGAFKRAIEEHDVVFRVGFQRRFHPMLMELKRLVSSGALGNVISARMNVGSYVPVWHPYEDWRQLYAVRADLGGGALLTEIHEIDLAQWFFGPPQDVVCRGGNWGKERLDVEDTALMLLNYGKFAVNINLCFMQEKPQRSIDIAGTAGHVNWDATGNILIHKDYASGNETRLADATFDNDLMFANQIKDLTQNFNTDDNEEHFRAAWTSQAIVEACKISMRTGNTVQLPALYADEISQGDC